MVPGMTRLGTLGAGLGLCLLTAFSVPGDPASADPGRLDDDRLKRPAPSITTRVDSNPNGYDVHISVRVAWPGNSGGEQNASAPSSEGDGRRETDTDTPDRSRRAPEAPGLVAGPAHPASDSSPPAPQNRTWFEGAVIHVETPDGQQIVMTPLLVTVWASDGPSPQQLRQFPGQGAYSLYVNGDYRGLVWQPLPPDPGVPVEAVAPLPPDVRPGGGGGLDPHSVALDILSHIPLPDIQIRMNPGLGLVNLPGWFWLEGYDGQPFGESRTIVIPPANPEDPNDHGTSFTVEVRVWASRYGWDFGDGKSLVKTSLGRRYPAESDIQHTYQHSSLAYPGGFPVRLTVEYAAEYRVNGGPPSGLPSVVRAHGAAYRVQEVQPVLILR
jgi:hypothetical protein